MLQFDAAALQTFLAILISIAAAITSWKTVLKPIWEKHRQKRKADEEFRQNCLLRQENNQKIVLEKLDDIEDRLVKNNKMIMGLQRDNLERAHFMFVTENGYCPSGIKESLSDIYANYPNKDVDGITKKRLADILDLPEHPTPG